MYSIMLMDVLWSKDLSLLVHYTMPLGKSFLIFVRIIVPSSSRLKGCTLKVKALQSLKTLETIYPPMQCNISECLNVQLHHCKKNTSHINWNGFKNGIPRKLVRLEIKVDIHNICIRCLICTLYFLYKDMMCLCS